MRFPEVKLLLGGGSAAPHSSVQSNGLFPRAKAEQTPPNFNMWKNESEGLSLTDTESLSSKEPELLSWLEGIFLKFMTFHPLLVHSGGTRPNQQGEIRFELRI